LKNIPGDIAYSIAAETDLKFYDEFVWQKQTSPNMFGAGLRPGNNISNNTTERITVFVKDGPARKFPASIVAANRITPALKRDLTQQTWFMYPADVKRDDHPAPFPDMLPGRLIRMFTFGAAHMAGGFFAGETVLDPFAGTGTTCVAAKRLRRNFVGIDINESYVEWARAQVERTVEGSSDDCGLWLFAGSPKWPDKAMRESQMVRELGNTGRAKGEAKHKRKSYGRKGMPASSLR
jgi:DNA modification methylase